MSKKKPKQSDNTIARNQKAFHDYFVEDRFEAGIALQGWEVKSLRDGRLQLRDAHVFIKNGEAFLLNALITPMPTVSTHFTPEPTRTRKLLLHRGELNRLIGAVERKGYTIVPLSMFWKHGLAKVSIGLAKGKQKQDKRATEKERDWQRQKQRLLRAK
jgi:SsrA-binding protein